MTEQRCQPNLEKMNTVEEMALTWLSYASRNLITEETKLLKTCFPGQKPGEVQEPRHKHLPRERIRGPWCRQKAELM